MMKYGFFVTGTDTEVGKTWATLALMHAFQHQGFTVAGMKPVAAGCEYMEQGWRNADALLLQQHASIALPYSLVNPYAYALPVSPHLADIANPVQFAPILAAFAQIQAQAEVVLVEGAGGWYAPLNATQDIADLALALALPVVLVVGIRLGCINHAKLSYRAISQSGLRCAGWLAACVDGSMLKRDANIATLVEFLPVPLLGVLPFAPQRDFAALAGHLNVAPLLS